MTRVHVICEGQTEEMFINEVLYEVFASKGICLIPALIGKPGHKGGNVKFERLLIDVRARLLGDTSAFCTTFLGLTQNRPSGVILPSRTSVLSSSVCLAGTILRKS